jgi:hypothetical protein
MPTVLGREPRGYSREAADSVPGAHITKQETAKEQISAEGPLVKSAKENKVRRGSTRGMGLRGT